MVERVINNLIEALTDADLLILGEGATPQRLSKELILALSQQSDVGVSFLAWFTNAVMESNLVEELFASDDELRNLYHGIR
jgi:hypothetical protein